MIETWKTQDRLDEESASRLGRIDAALPSLNHMPVVSIWMVACWTVKRA
jgi:hypothetical protein